MSESNAARDLALARSVLRSLRTRRLGTPEDDRHVCILIGVLKRGERLFANEREELAAVARRIAAGDVKPRRTRRRR